MLSDIFLRKIFFSKFPGLHYKKTNVAPTTLLAITTSRLSGRARKSCDCIRLFGCHFTLGNHCPIPKFILIDRGILSVLPSRSLHENKKLRIEETKWRISFITDLQTY